MSKRLTIIILTILSIGILCRLAFTADGNFLFNMDNGRDMVDVREMVVLKKLRLTGPTSAIEGLYNGPAWYYLLAVPFVLSGGDPYTSILMEYGLLQKKIQRKKAYIQATKLGLVYLDKNRATKLSQIIKKKQKVN